jgi:hypothetical protein
MILLYWKKLIKAMNELKSKSDYWIYFLAIVDEYGRDNMPEIFKTHRDLKVVYRNLQNSELNPSEEEIYEKQLKEFEDRQDNSGKSLVEIEI